jgi:hypothetical protein
MTLRPPASLISRVLIWHYAIGQRRDQRERPMRIFAHRALGLAEAGFANLCSRLLRVRLWPSADWFRMLTPDTYAMDRERSACFFNSVAASRAGVSAVDSRFEQRTLESRNLRACCLKRLFTAKMDRSSLHFSQVCVEMPSWQGQVVEHRQDGKICHRSSNLLRDAG